VQGRGYVVKVMLELRSAVEVAGLCHFLKHWRNSREVQSSCLGDAILISDGGIGAGVGDDCG